MAALQPRPRPAQGTGEVDRTLKVRPERNALSSNEQRGFFLVTVHLRCKQEEGRSFLSFKWTNVLLSVVS